MTPTYQLVQDFWTINIWESNRLIIMSMTGETWEKPHLASPSHSTLKGCSVLNTLILSLDLHVTMFGKSKKTYISSQPGNALWPFLGWLRTLWMVKWPPNRDRKVILNHLEMVVKDWMNAMVHAQKIPLNIQIQVVTLNSHDNYNFGVYLNSHDISW